VKATVLQTRDYNIVTGANVATATNMRMIKGPEPVEGSTSAARLIMYLA
jgi:hypothetical protein